MKNKIKRNNMEEIILEEIMKRKNKTSNSQSILQQTLQQREKGITLVALVITIVILIILAVIAINAVFGDSGLLKYAQDAKNYQANADISDAEMINGATSYIDGILGGNGSGSEIPEEPELPTGKSELEEAKDSGQKFEGTTTVKDDLENEVKVPGGFHIAEDSGTKVEEGVVIEDDLGNQFVWIPVGEYNVSATINSSGKLANNLSRREWPEIDVVAEPTELTENSTISGDDGFYYGEESTKSIAKDQIEEFKTSATNNKGFYIGRYEAGTETERTAEDDQLTMPLVQANKNAYVYVTRDQAKQQAEAMYNGNSYATSELMSSYAWDTTLNFICQTNEEGYKLATTTDKSYGNINTNIKELTGVYNSDNYCNIHDILGNCGEFTTEFFSAGPYPCVTRGGRYNYGYGDAIYRDNNSLNYSESNVAFRIQLYIK